MASTCVNILERQGCKCANFDAKIIPGEQNTKCQARVKNIPYAVSIDGQVFTDTELTTVSSCLAEAKSEYLEGNLE